MFNEDVGIIGSNEQGATELIVLSANDYQNWLNNRAAPLLKEQLEQQDANGQAGDKYRIFAADENRNFYIAVTSNDPSPYNYAHLPHVLPAGNYTLNSKESTPGIGHDLAFGWAAGFYCFDEYKTQKKTAPKAKLTVPFGADAREVNRLAQAAYLTRNLINTPANDMGPDTLTAKASVLASKFNARCRVYMASDNKNNTAAAGALYAPSLYSVGKAAQEKPRLVDIQWGEDETAPLVTLIGKGITYDSGGLALKPPNFMVNMKKDMGGAAHALSLGAALMDTNLPIRLRVLLPIAENAVNEKSYRNGDIIKSRKGTTIEITNTDAEGRLVLADAFTVAGEDEKLKPNLLVDFATLTGAAKMVAGPNTPVIFATDDKIAQRLQEIGREIDDRVQAVELDPRDKAQLESNIADISNSEPSRLPSHIYAAHFLQHFAPENVPHIHIDHSAWRAEGSPGRPQGATEQAIRLVYRFVKERYSAPKPAIF